MGKRQLSSACPFVAFSRNEETTLAVAAIPRGPLQAIFIAGLPLLVSDQALFRLRRFGGFRIAQLIANDVH